MFKTLLLADDSLTIQRVIELTFAHEDIRVVSVGDGKRALQWLESESPDIVLADVAVPEVDGYGVAEFVKQSARLRNVPVLLLAGAFEPVDQERVRAIGCEGVLIKPFEPQQLVTRVKALVDQPAPVLAGARAGETESTQVRRGPFDVFATDTVEVADPTPAAAPAKVSLVNAFSALLAAEQSTQPAVSPTPAEPVSDAAVEEAVRRVLVRMTDELVRRLVLETAERLIKEEIEKIKANPD
jgi:CheY-like chemotaxis protein